MGSFASSDFVLKCDYHNYPQIVMIGVTAWVQIPTSYTLCDLEKTNHSVSDFSLMK